MLKILNSIYSINDKHRKSNIRFYPWVNKYIKYLCKLCSVVFYLHFMSSGNNVDCNQNCLISPLLCSYLCNKNYESSYNSKLSLLNANFLSRNKYKKCLLIMFRIVSCKQKYYYRFLELITILEHKFLFYITLLPELVLLVLTNFGFQSARGHCMV